MGIFDWLRRKQKEPASVAERRRTTPVDDAIARLSDASDEERVGAAMELLKSSDYGVRAAVASELARLEIKAVGVWYELANALADGYESVRLASAKAFWQLDGVGYAIRSLRDEHENPAHISREFALRGIRTLMEAAPEKTNFDNLLKENWQDCPLLATSQAGHPKMPRFVFGYDIDNVVECAKCHQEMYIPKGWVNTPRSAGHGPASDGNRCLACESDTYQFDLGRVLYELGHWEEARSNFEKVARGSLVYGLVKRQRSG
ncbi:hypothetical protein HQ563_12200 [bacterium]|nr:hypothetical protein [bacterium]